MKFEVRVYRFSRFCLDPFTKSKVERPACSRLAK